MKNKKMYETVRKELQRTRKKINEYNNNIEPNTMIRKLNKKNIYNFPHKEKNKILDKNTKSLKSFLLPKLYNRVSKKFSKRHGDLGFGKINFKSSYNEIHTKIMKAGIDGDNR